jgi:transposase-like protein
MDYIEFSRVFPTELSIIEYFVNIEYEDGVVCPKCGAVEKVYRQKSRPRNAYCNNCKTNFSIFANTIFEKSDTDLRKWFYAINLVLASHEDVSALQLKREICVTYKTAGRMLKQIRQVMCNKDMSKAFEALYIN